MSWGLWKKFKKGIKKAGMWLKDKLGKAAKFAGKIKPELAKIEDDAFAPPRSGDQGWGKKLVKISDDIINVNEKVQKGDVAGAINYAGRQWAPKLKNSR